MHRLRIKSEHLATPLKTSWILTRGKDPRLRAALGVAFVMSSNAYQPAATIHNRKQEHFPPQLKLGRVLATWRLEIYRRGDMHSYWTAVFISTTGGSCSIGNRLHQDRLKEPR